MIFNVIATQLPLFKTMLKTNLLLILQENFPGDWTIFFSVIFLIGIVGIICQRTSFLITLLSIEIMYVGIICFSVSAAIVTSNQSGHVYALLFLIIAACESAVGLGVLIVLFKYGKSLSFVTYEELIG